MVSVATKCAAFSGTLLAAVSTASANALPSDNVVASLEVNPTTTVNRYRDEAIDLSSAQFNNGQSYRYIPANRLLHSERESTVGDSSDGTSRRYGPLPKLNYDESNERIAEIRPVAVVPSEELEPLAKVRAERLYFEERMRMTANERTPSRPDHEIDDPGGFTITVRGDSPGEIARSFNHRMLNGGDAKLTLLAFKMAGIELARGNVSEALKYFGDGIHPWRSYSELNE